MSIFNMISYIKRFYTTLHGKPIEKCNDHQIIAVYYSLQNRERKKLAETRYK